MKALITGASSGLGKDIAIYLDNLGYDTILVARDVKELNTIKSVMKNKCKIITIDLTVKEELYKLYEETKVDSIDLLVNNAGIGEYGEFKDIQLDKELNLIELNIIATHILTKLYLKDMIQKDSGRILNISSLASFSSGPFMATYYSSKSYLTAITTAIYQELKESNSNVKISLSCPGPFDSNFNNNIGIKFKSKVMSSKEVAKYTIDKCLKNKLIIIPGFKNKLAYLGIKFLPLKLISKINYNIQKSKFN